MLSFLRGEEGKVKGVGQVVVDQISLSWLGCCREGLCVPCVDPRWGETMHIHNLVWDQRKDERTLTEEAGVVSVEESVFEWRSVAVK